MIRVNRLDREDGDAAEALSRILIAAWRTGFRGILSDEIIEKYTEFEGCKAMFAQLLSSGVGTMYLGELDGSPAGLLYWLPEGEDARLEALLTVPEAWGKGVGPALMERALADMAEAGVEAAHVWPFGENRRARRFYEKHGFAPSGKTHMGDALELEYIRRIT